jgi:hypothetical protein
LTAIIERARPHLTDAIESLYDALNLADGEVADLIGLALADIEKACEALGVPAK